MVTIRCVVAFSLCINFPCRCAAYGKKVRNCIVHSKGSIDERKDELDIRSFISDIPTIDIDKYGRVVILDGFVHNTTHTANLLSHRLLEVIYK